MQLVLIWLPIYLHFILKNQTQRRRKKKSNEKLANDVLPLATCYIKKKILPKKLGMFNPLQTKQIIIWSCYSLLFFYFYFFLNSYTPQNSGYDSKNADHYTKPPQSICRCTIRCSRLREQDVRSWWQQIANKRCASRPFFFFF